MQYGIYVGSSKEGIEAAHKAIIAILEMNVAEGVTKRALDVLTEVCSVRNTSISNCTFGDFHAEEEDNNDE
jgi:hypothetical protein